MDIVTYALLKKNKLTQANSYGDFPEKGTSGAIYLAKDTGQTYYWDDVTQTYIKTGTAGRTGVYAYDGSLPTEIGADAEINKSDLEVIVEPTTPYSEGSEIAAANAVHALIISSTEDKVTVKTITDMTIDSFRQVATVSDLPETGSINVLYAIKDIKQFRVWNSATNSYNVYPIITKTDLGQDLQDEIDGKQNKADIQRHKNAFTFDGSTTTFDIPNSIDIDHIDAIYINGILLTEGIDNDYVINKNQRKIEFAEAWDAEDSAYVACE